MGFQFPTPVVVSGLGNDATLANETQERREEGWEELEKRFPQQEEGIVLSPACFEELLGKEETLGATAAVL